MSFCKIDRFHSSSCSYASFDDSSSFNNTVSGIAKASLGVVTSISMFSYVSFAEEKIVSVMTGLKLDMSADQDIIAVWNSLNNLPFSLLRMVAKTILTSYIVIIGPILEEVLFRFGLHEVLNDVFSDNFAGITVRVISNGLIFGACHLSPFQGWVNVPIFFITSALGIVFALLREVTGDIIAPSVAHMTHNGISMYYFLRV